MVTLEAAAEDMALGGRTFGQRARVGATVVGEDRAPPASGGTRIRTPRVGVPSSLPGASMNNGLPLALGAVALLAAAGRVKRGSAAVALPYAARPMGGGLYEVVEVRTGARPRSGEGSYEDDRSEVERLVEQLNRDALLRRLSRVGPSADWVNNAWGLSGGRVLFEDDDGDLLVLRRHGDDDEGEIEELARYRTVAEAAAALGLA